MDHDSSENWLAFDAMLIAAWVAATATALALIASLGVFWVQRQDTQRQQARKVSAWVKSTGRLEFKEAPFPTMGDYLVTTNPEHTFRVGLTVRNVSDEPVWDLRVGVLSDWGPTPELVGDRSLGVFPPGDANLLIDCAPLLPASIQHATPAQFPPVRIGFADASGRRWVRGPTGQLTDWGLSDHPIGRWRKVKVRLQRKRQ